MATSVGKILAGVAGLSGTVIGLQVLAGLARSPFRQMGQACARFRSDRNARSAKLVLRDTGDLSAREKVEIAGYFCDARSATVGLFSGIAAGGLALTLRATRR